MVEGFQPFGDDPLVADGGHEVGVPDPAGDDMEMKVVVHARSGGFPQIPANVEALGFDAFFEQGLGMGAEMPEFDDLFLGEVAHFGDLAVGDRHQVTDRIGIPVHEEKSLFATGHDEVGGIVTSLGGLGQKIGWSLLLGLEILHPPGSPE